MRMHCMNFSREKSMSVQSNSLNRGIQPICVSLARARPRVRSMTHLSTRKFSPNPGQRNLSPRIFHVNWFRKDAADKFFWPGFGENFRVLKWVIDRTRGRARASETQIGWMPRYSEFDWTDMDFSREKFVQCMRIDAAEWQRELISQTELFLTLHDRLPKELIFQRELLISRL